MLLLLIESGDGCTETCWLWCAALKERNLLETVEAQNNDQSKWTDAGKQLRGGCANPWLLSVGFRATTDVNTTNLTLCYFKNRCRFEWATFCVHCRPRTAECQTVHKVILCRHQLFSNFSSLGIRNMACWCTPLGPWALQTITMCANCLVTRLLATQIQAIPVIVKRNNGPLNPNWTDGVTKGTCSENEASHSTANIPNAFF
jgi:hypothetical protein